MTARNQHFISQSYLKWFTKGQAKNSKLVVFDFKENKRFETTPRNVGADRDFNRVEVDGVDPLFIEKELGKFEGDLGPSIETLIATHQFTGAIRERVLYLIALLAVRTPLHREHARKTHELFARRIMDVALSSKEIWESQLRQMVAAGGPINSNVTYQEMKEFHEGGAYRLEVSREHQISLEASQVDALLPLLAARRWLLVKATPESGPFVTSDNPVTIRWIDPESVPPFHRDSPGYGLKGTRVIFPIAPSIALIGEFDGQEVVIDANLPFVAAVNTDKIWRTNRQLYSQTNDFHFNAPDGTLLSGHHVLDAYTRKKDYKA